jgi:hypothetical protein
VGKFCGLIVYLDDNVGVSLLLGGRQPTKRILCDAATSRQEHLEVLKILLNNLIFQPRGYLSLPSMRDLLRFFSPDTIIKRHQVLVDGLG